MKNIIILILLLISITIDAQVEVLQQLSNGTHAIDKNYRETRIASERNYTMLRLATLRNQRNNLQQAPISYNTGQQRQDNRFMAYAHLKAFKPETERIPNISVISTYTVGEKPRNTTIIRN